MVFDNRMNKFPHWNHIMVSIVDSTIHFQLSNLIELFSFFLVDCVSDMAQY